MIPKAKRHLEPTAFQTKKATNRLNTWESHIGGMVLFKLTGSTLDKNSERDALVRLPLATRQRLIKAAIAGQTVSAITEWAKIKDDGYLVLKFRAKTRRGLINMLLRQATILERLEHLPKERYHV